MEKQCSKNENQEPPQVVVVPGPGMGHLIPLTEFAKILHAKHHFSITLILPLSIPPTQAQTSYLSTLPAGVSHTFLPVVDPTLLPSHTVAHEVTIAHMLRHSVPSLRESLAYLTRQTRVVALVTDLFGTLFFDVAKEFGVPPYMYFTTNAFCLSFFLHLPRLDEMVCGAYRDLKEPLTLPGCIPLSGKDFMDPVQDRNDENYTVFLDHIANYHLPEGIFINTFMDLEPNTLNALSNEYPNMPPIYPVGPNIQSGLGNGSDESVCLNWLDQQPLGSVIFVSFGSGGTLLHEQLNELAIGLEKSGQRFLWVVRSPSKISTSSFFTGLSEHDPFSFLPIGFVDRIKDHGLLVPSWAPQIKVLGHKSTGGFVSHCGWNSTLESITNGVPMIAWPVYAEQKMNAVILTQGLHVALRPKANEHGLIEAHEIAKVCKELIEGEEGERVRLRMKHLSDCAKRAVSEDGDSTNVLKQVALKWSQT